MKEGKTPEHYMRQVLALATEALEFGEFPIAAIVVLDDQIIARATASEQREKRFLGHAELAALTSAIQLELVNQFTNWFFLVIVPFSLLLIARGRGLALRATLRSVGITRTGLKNSLRLSAIMAPLSIPVLYVVGDQQRAAIEMVFQKPLQALVSFLVSFPLALLTAGFGEEFFFRGVLQPRLARCLGAEWRGLLMTSLLFGLLHLPMYFFSPFEPTHGDLLWALSSGITGQAVMGIRCRTEKVRLDVRQDAIGL